MDRNQCSGWTGARKEYDLVRIYSRDRFRERRTVSIEGMVNRPGGYQFWNGMTWRDLVMLAAGRKDGAYLDSAEVARLPADRSGGRLAVTLKVRRWPWSRSIT